MLLGMAIMRAKASSATARLEASGVLSTTMPFVLA